MSLSNTYRNNTQKPPMAANRIVKNIAPPLYQNFSIIQMLVVNNHSPTL
jgi:hypothetical protein